MNLSKLIVACAFAALAACTTSAPDIAPTRGPIGKADLVGSCADACGGQSEDSCWCDDLCASYGDCCEDKQEQCDTQVELCGGFAGLTCDDDGDYCNYPAGQCQFADNAGTCVPKPEVCPQVVAQVCGCNGTTYSNGCFAAAAGINVLHSGPCEAIPQCDSDDDCLEIPCLDGNPVHQTCEGGFCVNPPASACHDLCDDFVGPCNSDTDCGDGMECKFDPATCSPSSCGCAPETGEVFCTADCGGGECVPAAPGCTSNNDCIEIVCPNGGFAHGICEGGTCTTPVCASPGNSCEDNCGGQSDDGSCWCDAQCAGFGDCCGDVADHCE